MRIALACPFLLGFLLSLPAIAETATYAGNTIAYQGRLELDGQPVNATVSMTFRFYASETSTEELGTYTTDVTPAGGAFALKIGPLPNAVFEADELWLAIEVDDVALGGRQRVQAPPAGSPKPRGAWPASDTPLSARATQST